MRAVYNTAHAQWLRNGNAMGLLFSRGLRKRDIQETILHLSLDVLSLNVTVSINSSFSLANEPHLYANRKLNRS